MDWIICHRMAERVALEELSEQVVADLRLLFEWTVAGIRHHLQATIRQQRGERLAVVGAKHEVARADGDQRRGVIVWELVSGVVPEAGPGRPGETLAGGLRTRPAGTECRDLGVDEPAIDQSAVPGRRGVGRRVRELQNVGDRSALVRGPAPGREHCP